MMSIGLVEVRRAAGALNEEDEVAQDRAGGIVLAITERVQRLRQELLKPLLQVVAQLRACDARSQRPDLAHRAGLCERQR
jgi:hypothetical protein